MGNAMVRVPRSLGFTFSDPDSSLPSARPQWIIEVGSVCQHDWRYIPSNRPVISNTNIALHPGYREKELAAQRMKYSKIRCHTCGVIGFHLEIVCPRY